MERGKKDKDKYNGDRDWDDYFIEKDPPVSLPVSGSRKASFRQQSVGRPTSYLMPTIFISSCS